jgi:hypothetical protein
MDVLAVKLKRLREKVTLNAFNIIARDLLDDYMFKSNNLNSITLFKAISIRHYVIFYSKELLKGRL